MLITNVNDLSKKSFKHYTGPSKENYFTKRNIVFGYNGRGKSSLAHGIVEEFEKTKKNESETFRFFDRNYIMENILLKDGETSTLKGVIANFGKKDVDSEKNIEELEKSLVDTDVYINNMGKLKTEIKKEINHIHDKRKEAANIKRKSDSLSIEEIISSYQKDYEAAKNISNDEELKKITGNDELEKKLLLISNLTIPSLVQIQSSVIDNIQKILNTNFNDIQIPSTEIIKWLNEGLNLHSNKNKCLFCGNELNKIEIEKKIKNFNENAKQLASIELINFNNNLFSLMTTIKNILENKDSYLINIGEEISKNIDKLNFLYKNIINCMDIISKKIDNMSESINFNLNALFEEIDKCIECLNEINCIKANKETLLQKKIDKMSVLIKGGIYLEITQNTLINSSINQIEENNKLYNKGINNNADINKKIEELKNSKSNTKDFANHINKILASIEVDLRLMPYEDDYIIMQRNSSEKLQLKDISEGEQNLLALLYFYYELFEDEEQKNIKSSIKLIILDDPISSVDDTNKMYIIELIKNLYNYSDQQLFVFTHVWDDFCNICYGKNPNSDHDYKFYEIKKDASGSKIVIAKTNETPYQHGFKEIYELSQKLNNDILDDCEIYHYPNVMRKVLEGFLTFKIKNPNPTAKNKEAIKTLFSQNEWLNSDDIKLSTLLSVCNTLSHKFSRTSDEIIKSAKFLMSKVENIDKSHFNTMKQ